MNKISSEIKKKICQAIREWCLTEGLVESADISRINVEFSDRPEHGEISTNAAMILAKIYKQSPQSLYDQWSKRLSEIPEFSEVSFVAPGFINFVLQKKCWYSLLCHVILHKDRYGCTRQGHDKRVNLEFVSANPTGPLHLAHVRGAVVGDILANTMQTCGYAVDREYYINDLGGQIKALAQSLYRRYGEVLQKRKLIKSADEYIDSEQAYPGEYLLNIAEEIVDSDGAKHWKRDWDIEFFSCFAVSRIMDGIKEDLKLLGINFQNFVSEKSLHEDEDKKTLLSEAVEILNRQNLLYEGTIAGPKAKKFTEKQSESQEHRLLFRSTEFGDDQDRYLKKENGDWTYFASDVAYHLDKLKRGYDELIFILGADHSGYVKRITALTKPLSWNKSNSHVYLCQLVKIVKDNVALKLSKRKGTIVTLRDLVKTLGADATRLAIIGCRREMPLDIDLQKIQEQSMHNPVFYIQYAHARCYSVLSKVRDLLKHKTKTTNTAETQTFINDDLQVNLIQEAQEWIQNLTGDLELDLMRFMARWTDVIQRSLAEAEPNVIVTYLQTFAAKFHALWNQGKKCHTDRFIDEDDLSTTKARAALVYAASIVLGNGLKILGVKAPRSM